MPRLSVLRAALKHPRLEKLHGLPELIVALLDCSQACWTCVEACVAEDNSRTLGKCIRLAMDSATICTATAEVLSRSIEPDDRVLSVQVFACRVTLSLCDAQCEKLAKRHPQCDACAEACRLCERLCSEMAAHLPAVDP